MIKLILILPIVWVLTQWAKLVIPEKWYCTKCLSFWLTLPLLPIPQQYLELAAIPSTIALIYYLVDTYTDFFNPKIRL